MCGRRSRMCLLVSALLLCSLPAFSSPSLDVDPEAEYRITGAELLELWSLIDEAAKASIELRNVSNEELEESRKRVVELETSYAESQNEARSERRAKESWRTATAVLSAVTVALTTAMVLSR
ncbi:MAG: hypothetical protein ACOC2D_12470 [Spirochaetota bacterium]